MKKRITSLLLALILILGSVTVTVAAESTYVDRIEIIVDVPVNGLELKTEALVDAYSDALDTYYSIEDLPVKVDSVVWYPANSGTPLKKGTKATMGSSYQVSVTLIAKSGYAFPDNFAACPHTLNGQPVTPQKFSDGTTDYWVFSATFATVAASSGPLTVVVKDMELSPYEGNPMEVLVQATGSTNIRYQWQVVHGDSEVEVEDNFRYSGCRTPHFRMNSYFGDTWDTDLNFCKVRCKVTSDNGTAYSQEVWYSLIDRTVASSVAVSGLEQPVSGKAPDTTVSTDNAEIASVSKVEWFGPANSRGGYPKMTESTFSGGKYRCRIYLDPADAYKFGESTKVTLDGKEVSYTTISGAETNPFGPDSYYIEKNFTVLPVVQKADVSIPLPLTGQFPDNSLSSVRVNGQGYQVVDVDWTDEEGFILREDQAFVADKTYLCILQIKTTGNYIFPANRADFAGYVNGQKARISQNYNTNQTYLELPFTATPVMREVYTEVDLPAIGDLAIEDLSVATPLGKGYRIVNIDWTDPEGYIIPENKAFEAGKEYLCILKLVADDGAWFTEKRADFTGYVNGEKADISINHAQKSTYLEYKFTPKPAVLYGDADENGKVDAADALKALQHAVKLITLEGDLYTAANVNGDDKIDATDALLMLQYTVKLIDKFPVE